MDNHKNYHKLSVGDFQRLALLTFCKISNMLPGLLEALRTENLMNFALLKVIKVSFKAEAFDVCLRNFKSILNDQFILLAMKYYVCLIKASSNSLLLFFPRPYKSIN